MALSWMRGKTYHWLLLQVEGAGSLCPGWLVPLLDRGVPVNGSYVWSQGFVSTEAWNREELEDCASEEPWHPKLGSINKIHIRVYYLEFWPKIPPLGPQGAERARLHPGRYGLLSSHVFYTSLPVWKVESLPVPNMEVLIYLYKLYARLVSEKTPFYSRYSTSKLGTWNFWWNHHVTCPIDWKSRKSKSLQALHIPISSHIPTSHQPFK